MTLLTISGTALAAAAGYLLTASGRRYRSRCSSRKLEARIDALAAKLLSLSEYNYRRAGALLAEWQTAPDTNARDIWSEEEVRARVETARRERDREVRVHDTYLKCRARFGSNFEHPERQAEYTALYVKYLEESMEYRQCLNIVPLTAPDAAVPATPAGEGMNGTECEKYRRVVAECERKLAALLSS